MNWRGSAALGAGLCAGIGLGLFGTQAQAQNFSGIIFFGDSNTDSGRYLYLPAIKNNPASFASAGGYTTNPSPLWSNALGSYLGFTVTPSDAPNGGNNY